MRTQEPKGPNMSALKVIEVKYGANKKKLAAHRVSRAVPHLSTNRALSRLTSEFGWDPVHMA